MPRGARCAYGSPPAWLRPARELLSASVEVPSCSARILIAADFTESSKPALLSGLELGRRLGAQVNVLHVTNRPSRRARRYLPVHQGRGLVPARHRGKMRDAAKHVLEDQVKGRRPIRVRTTRESSSRIGIAADVIVSLAKDTGVNLIVLGAPDALE